MVRHAHNLLQERLDIAVALEIGSGDTHCEEEEIDEKSVLQKNRQFFDGETASAWHWWKSDDEVDENGSGEDSDGEEGHSPA